MKKCSSTTVCLLILIFLMLSTKGFSQDTQGIPKLALAEREFDFGRVKEGRQITHDFTLQNKGNAPLEIKRVRPG